MLSIFFSFILQDQHFGKVKLLETGELCYEIINILSSLHLLLHDSRSKSREKMLDEVFYATTLRNYVTTSLRNVTIIFL